jgi:putative methionine-R-sulfoxide reductase with GAF domain
MYSRIVYQYNFSTKKIKKFSFDKLPSEKKISLFKKELTGTVFQLKNGQIVVALPQRGLAIYQPESDNFFIVNAENNKTYAYHTEKKTESAVFFLQDNELNVLIGNPMGINIYNPGKQQFFTHGLDIATYKLFPKMPASDFLEMPDGDVLISYENLNGGIVRTDSALNFKKHYLIRKNETEIHPVNQIWNLFKDTKGIVWAPTQAKTIVKYNAATDELREETDTVLSGPLNTIKQDEKGIIWAGHWNKGLVKIDEATHTKQFFTQFKSTDTASHKRVYRILLDGNKIWVGTLENGLQVFDKTTEKFTESYEADERNKDAISSNIVKDIIRYNKDTLIIATFMGVNIFDLKTKKFKAITVKEGLPSNLVEGIMLDKNKNLWVVSAGGDFCRINLHNFFITRYNVNDGIIDNGLWGRVVQLTNGTGLIASAQSFISFNPESIAASAPPANVLITSCNIFEKEVAVVSLIKNNEPLQLSYKENSLRIEFASLEFWNPGSIEYFYKLNGIDKDWIAADKTNAAIYNQLTDGKYIFEIKCANRDGIYCKSVTQLKIIINPPFWKTWWFITAMILLSILLIFFLIKLREKNIKTINAEKFKVQQLNAEKLKSKLELEQIVNYFSSSLVDKYTVDDVLWDAAKNLIRQLGFVDCMMYLWNSEQTKMVQRAGYGTKDSVEKIKGQHFDVKPGQGLVGYVIQTKEPVLIADTSADSRYRIDDIERLSEITVPIIWNDELLGVIDSEHPEKNFFTGQHMQVLTTIATLLANKIKSLEVEKSLQDARVEMYSINERLSEARLEALRSQMNPHFIFNSLNAIQECILTNKVDAAYEYLSRFSKLQRMVLNNSAKEFIPLGSELEMLHLYLSLESLRFSQSFTYTIHTDAGTDVDEIMLPSMIIQPYVENAIWHGLRNKTGDKILTVTCKEIAGELIITIDDNGIGREKAAIIKSHKLGAGKSESKGTVLSAQRLNILALQYNASIHLEVTDKVNEANEPTGTTVVIRLPSNIETIQP